MHPVISRREKSYPKDLLLASSGQLQLILKASRETRVAVIVYSNTLKGLFFGSHRCDAYQIDCWLERRSKTTE